METIITDIRGCARCGGDHGGLRFVPLNNPPEEFTHFAVCPLANQPVLLASHACLANLADEETAGRSPLAQK